MKTKCTFLVEREEIISMRSGNLIIIGRFKRRVLIGFPLIMALITDRPCLVYTKTFKLCPFYFWLHPFFLNQKKCLAVSVCTLVFWSKKP